MSVSDMSIPGYKRLDYIESNGTQYIDTGVKAPATELKFKVCAALTNLSQLSAIFGSNGGNGQSLMYFGSSDSRFQWRGDYGRWYSPAPVINTFYEMECGEDYFILNDETMPKDYTGQYYSNNYTVKVCATNHNSSSISYYSYSRIRYLKIYQNDILIRDFIPVLRVSDNAVGLLDVENNVFYENQGTGTFAYGSILDDINLYFCGCFFPN